MSNTREPTCTHIGGQAVIEGVMMRGKKNWAVSVRDPHGVIQSEEHDLTSAAAKNAWMKWPLIRGCVAMVESVALGTKALTISAQLAATAEDAAAAEEAQAQDSQEPASTDDKAQETPQINDVKHPGEALSGAMMAGTFVVAILFAVGLFIVLPALLTNLLSGSIADNPVRWNVVDGLLRALAFFAYVWVIGRWSEMNRVFRYHGAEHQVIHALEAGEELTVQNARKYSPLHVRCGTAFLLMVIVLSIVVFSLIPIRMMIAGWGIASPALVTLLTIISRLLLLPLVAGLAYELTVKWAGPRADKPYVKVLLWPGLQMQRLTTAEPDDAMLEVAIASTKLVVAAESAEDVVIDEEPLPEGDEEQDAAE